MKKPDTLENQVKYVYLALGSNLGKKIKNLELAKYKLSKIGVNIIKTSSFYCTKSWPNTKFPDFIYELNYENLINNQQKETEKLIKFCDLEWEEQCLKFYNATPIQTVSIYQTRKPIYKSSININEKYSEFSDFFKKIDNL